MSPVAAQLLLLLLWLLFQLLLCGPVCLLVVKVMLVFNLADPSPPAAALPRPGHYVTPPAVLTELETTLPEGPTSTVKVRERTEKRAFGGIAGKQAVGPAGIFFNKVVPGVMRPLLDIFSGDFWLCIVYRFI